MISYFFKPKPKPLAPAKPATAVKRFTPKEIAAMTPFELQLFKGACWNLLGIPAARVNIVFLDKTNGDFVLVYEPHKPGADV